MKKMFVFTLISLVFIQKSNSQCIQHKIDIPLDSKSQYGVAQTVNNYCYHFWGGGINNPSSEFYKYDNDALFVKITDSVSAAPQSRNFPVNYCFGDSLYVGLGFETGGGNYYNDFYRFDHITNTFYALDSFPGRKERDDAIFFTLNGKFYYGLGNYLYNGANDFFNDIWEFDPTNNTWSLFDTSFNNTYTGIPLYFVENNKMYIQESDFWEFDPLNINHWTLKQNKSWATGFNGYSDYKNGNSFAFTKNSDSLIIYKYSESTDELIYQCSTFIPNIDTFAYYISGNDTLWNCNNQNVSTHISYIPTNTWSGEQSIYFELWADYVICDTAFPVYFKNQIWKYDYSTQTIIEEKKENIKLITYNNGVLKYELNSISKFPLQIFNISGQLVKSISLDKTIGYIDVILTPGIYIFSQENYTRKFITY